MSTSPLKLAFFCTSLFLIGIVSVILFDAPSTELADGQNVRMENGQQVITIAAKGGYSPRSTTAQAGIPTILEFKTSGSFDCSSALVIPSLNYQVNLPASGLTTLELPAQEANTTLTGLCAMGMYSFKISFIE